jgi:hypothetical protein
MGRFISGRFDSALPYLAESLAAAKSWETLSVLRIYSGSDAARFAWDIRTRHVRLFNRF